MLTVTTTLRKLHMRHTYVHTAACAFSQQFFSVIYATPTIPN